MSRVNSIIERHPLVDNKRLQLSIKQSIRSVCIVICMLLLFSFSCFVILFFTTNSQYISKPPTIEELTSQLREFENEIATFQQELPENKKEVLMDDIILIKSLAPKFEKPLENKEQDFQYLKSTLSNFSTKFDQFLDENPDLKSQAGVICGKKDMIFGIALNLESKNNLNSNKKIIY